MLIALILCKQQISYSCSIRPESRIHHYDESEYLIEGRIIDYSRAEMVHPLSEKGSTYETWGLKMVVFRVTYPSVDLDTLEIYKFGLSAICSPLPRTLEQVKEEYAIGSEIAVVGKKGSMVDPLGEIPKRLQTNPFYGGIYPIAEGRLKPRMIRMRELLYKVALANPGQLESKIENLVLLGELYTSLEWSRAIPSRPSAPVDSLSSPREISYTNEMSYSMTLLRYIESQEELSMLEQELERRGFPGLPIYLKTEEEKIILRDTYQWYYPGHELKRDYIPGL